jgi:hypothetical protein
MLAPLTIIASDVNKQRRQLLNGEQWDYRTPAFLAGGLSVLAFLPWKHEAVPF